MQVQQSLKAKIYTGFAIIVGLLVLNGVISYSGMNRLGSELELMQRAEDLSAGMLRIDRDVQELELRVGRFVATGYDSQRDAAEKIYERLAKSIDEVKVVQKEQEIQDLFQEIDSHLRIYVEKFETVVELRQFRAELVQTKLPQQSDEVDALLSELISEMAENQATPEQNMQLLEVTRVGALFAQSEQAFIRYFQSPDTLFVNDAVERLQAAYGKIPREQPEKTTAASRVIAKIKEFERTGLEAVQATRSYLFFLNVVMAAEASEVSYYSNQLRERASQLRTQLAERVDATNLSVRRWTGITVIGALLLATLIAARIAYAVVPPITALTQTFESLANGESLAGIPGVDRQDEIGSMAKAAGVFSEQNERTQQLFEESRKLSAELRQQTSELEEINEELDSFAYIASHDLKSPLRGIRQLATWIEEDAGEHLPKESLEHLNQLKSRIAKMEHLLEDLLGYSRVGRLSPDPEEVDMQRMMQDIVEIMDNPKQVAVTWPNDLPSFETLRPPLEQVVTNLVGNAVKHNNKEANGLVQFSWEEEDGRYRFRVQDNGPGIDEKHHQRVFQMYQRVGDPSIDGSGMGLAIVKKQIEHLGGEVTLKSKPGVGSSFEFTWPIELPANQEEKDV